MSAPTTVAIRADVNQVDDTGYVWAYLSESTDSSRIVPGAVIVAGDSIEPFLARAVDVVNGPAGDSTVHLDVLDAAHDQVG